MYVAVITGASKGLGEEFARQLAARRMNLLLVARSTDLLEKLGTDLEQRYGVRVYTLAVDLAEPRAAEKVLEYIKAHGIHPTWLVNNAGFGMAGGFDSLPLDRTRGMMMLNMVALVELTHLLLPMLRLGRDARIINVASAAAFQPVPFFNVYAATKAFVLHFSEALREELRGTEVKVLALCPGPTATRFHEGSNLNPALFEKGQTAHHVVREGLRASDARRTVLVTSRAPLIMLQRFFPRAFIRWAAGFVARRMVGKGALKPD